MDIGSSSQLTPYVGSPNNKGSSNRPWHQGLRKNSPDRVSLRARSRESYMPLNQRRTYANQIDTRLRTGKFVSGCKPSN